MIMQQQLHKQQTNANIQINNNCIFDNLRYVLELRKQTYFCYEKDKNIHYGCKVKNNYTYYGYLEFDGNYKYTEISKKNAGPMYRYYPKILTYSNEYTTEPIIYTQEYDHPRYIELWHNNEH